MSQKDPYKILGVDRSAGQDEIKRAYRRLAKEYHPDRNPNNPSAEQRFKEVQAAYEVLGDSKRRAQYDQFGAGGPAPEYQQWAARAGGSPYEGVHFDFGSFGDLSSIFEQFFQRGRSGMGGRGSARGARQAPARGGNLEHSITLTFDEALRGTTREVVLSGGGAPERIEFRVPAGVHDGQKIRVRGKGHGAGGGRGDLLIRCDVRPHAYYRREGLDLYVDVPLSVREAILGASVEVPTPSGSTMVKVPSGTSSGKKLRLRGRGVHDERSGKTGDLFVVVRIEVPKEVSERARALIEELDSELEQRPRATMGWSQ